METKKNYKQVCAELAQLQKQKELYDRLHDLCGIKYDNVHLFRFPFCKSGYSMGETLVVKVNGKLIATQNQEAEYAKSCKWKAQHGYMLFEFTKKDFKKVINLNGIVNHETYMCLHCMEEYKQKHEEALKKYSTLLSDMWREAFNRVSSDYKAMNINNVSIY